MLTIFLWLIIIICLLIIGSIIARHWQQLIVINSAGSVDRQQPGEVKKRILEQRLERHLLIQGNKLIISLKPFFYILFVWLKKFWQMVVNIEQKYKARLLKQNFAKKVDQQQYLNQKIKEAADLLAKNKFSESEKKYINVLTLDNRNLSAYWGLARIYASQENYDQAQETLAFLLKLQPGHNQARKLLAQVAGSRGDLILAKKCLEQLLQSEPRDISLYLSLAAAEMGLENADIAQTVLQTGLLVEPNNPKLLDYLIEVSIINNDLETAAVALRTLQTVNPENAKIEEFHRRINQA
jgi:tetratricopeptide (TPR) repeat protein